MKGIRACAFGAAAFSLAWVASGAGQPVPDHLQCYKVKDSQPKGSYTADLDGLTAEPGCSIKVPGTLLCVATTKTNVTPTPPGGMDDTGPAGRFLCYKVKCNKATVASLQWHDQFGARTVTPSTAKLVCAPEILPTTTTTSSTATTTSSSSTTTTMCTPTTCGAQGANCGTLPDGCGGTLDCGSCTGTDTCGGGGTPNVCGCTDDGMTCINNGQICGPAINNCGHSISCGTCGAGRCCFDSCVCSSCFCP